MPRFERAGIRDLISYPPLIAAWVWELCCIAAAVVMVTRGAETLIPMCLIFAGVLPFGAVFLQYMWTYKRIKEGPADRRIVR